MNSKPPVICIMGATATGKTKLAIELAQHFPLDIISVDSAMVYRDMNIGTAKPTATELKMAPHQLIDICDPAEPYSAGRFRRDARNAINESLSKNRIPLLVGGTMLYFNVLQKGVASLPSANESIRQKLLDEAKKQGWPAMHEKLKSIDPVTAAQLHPNDSQRIQRALEVFEITGEPISLLQTTQSNEPIPYHFVNLSLEPEDRAHLHNRIAKRFQLMMQEGFLDEVSMLKKREELHEGLPSIRTVGYRQAWSYLNNEYDKQTMEERAIIATRQLAKRQITWLRRWQPITRYSYETSNLLELAKNLIKKELNYENCC